MNCRRSPHNRGQAGFGLLEALVALVLLTSVGFALLAWVQQNLDSLQRMRGFYEEVDTRRSVLEWSRTLDPLKNPSGETAVGSLRLSWKSERVAGPVTQIGYPAGVGLHDLGLYDVSIAVFRPGVREAWFVLKVVCVGHRRARESPSPFRNG